MLIKFIKKRLEDKFSLKMQVNLVFYALILLNNSFLLHSQVNLVNKKVLHKWGVEFKLSEKLSSKRIYKYSFSVKIQKKIHSKLRLYSVINDGAKRFPKASDDFLFNKMVYFKTQLILDNPNNIDCQFVYYHASNGTENSVIFWLIDEFEEYQGKWEFTEWKNEIIIEHVLVEDVTESYEVKNLVPNGDFEVYHMVPLFSAGQYNGFTQERDWQKLDEFKYDTIYAPNVILHSSNLKKAHNYLPRSYTNKRRKTLSVSSGPNQVSMDNLDCIVNYEPFSGRNFAIIQGITGAGNSSGSSLVVKLKYPLMRGKKYSFSLMYKIGNASKYFITNKIGVMLTRHPVSNLSYSEKYIPEEAIVFELSKAPLSDTVWTRISKTFIANGQEQYLTIGRMRLPGLEEKEDTLIGKSGMYVYPFGHLCIDQVGIYAVDSLE